MSESQKPPAPASTSLLPRRTASGKHAAVKAEFRKKLESLNESTMELARNLNKQLDDVCDLNQIAKKLDGAT